ncbi:MAG: NADH-quinone oxidoreductase subunit L [Chloroflexi bacterium]|nr:NADH-quinone oxidoreductase subunit L [Chloroflexota bacterium]
MVTEQLIWLIFLLPLISFFICSVIVRQLLNHHSIIAGYTAIILIGLSFLISVLAFYEVIINHNEITSSPIEWLTIGKFSLSIGLLLDPLTIVMLTVVTGVSLMVQIYSLGYMKGEDQESNHAEDPVELGQPVLSRYFSYMSLFTASMLGLILASNIIQLFIFWELVGLCSYLLIGFWFHKPSAAKAAKKAFLVTRLGDFGFLLGIMYLFSHQHLFPSDSNPLDIITINTYVPLLVNTGLISLTAITLITLGIFFGAMGKSGQFPLHTWLPDAMEGPTPVSALIHAATMVAAGVFLVARFFPIFEISEFTMTTVSLIGAITAIFAATMGLVANDIKRVLAYSTVSQLGYMMLALGCGAYGAAIFHLFTHAFFKALLFLGSGSVNHATGTFDMRFMGGLRKVMPITFITFLIGGLSLAGIPPFSGFWSKDEILLNVFNHADHLSQDGHMWLSLITSITFALALVAVFMTAFYMFRALFITFEGEFNGGSDKDPHAHAHGPVHLSESPKVMTTPMIILASVSIFIGFIINPPFKLFGIDKHWLVENLQHGVVSLHTEFNLSLAVVSSIIAISGILLAASMYVKIPVLNSSSPLISPKSVSKIFQPLNILFTKKYYFDELYEDLIVSSIFYKKIAKFLSWFDQNIIDVFVNSIGWSARNIGIPIKQIHNGQIQMYATITSLGILVITFFIVFGT